MGEKFARGLDISMDYVIISAPPSSPSAYIHLAGQTGRNGWPGMAITLVQGMKEARRVVALAGALEVGFGYLATASKESVAIQRKALTVEQAMAEGGSTPQINNPWENLTKSALTRKMVAELTEYLMERVSQLCL
jgi:superfamily II DNA/RNA helicase